MSENIIQDWINSDPALLKIITQISATEKPFEEQALDSGTASLIDCSR